MQQNAKEEALPVRNRVVPIATYAPNFQEVPPGQPLEDVHQNLSGQRLDGFDNLHALGFGLMFYVAKVGLTLSFGSLVVDVDVGVDVVVVVSYSGRRCGAKRCNIHRFGTWKGE
jgi:hypothetical protein